MLKVLKVLHRIWTACIIFLLVFVGLQSLPGVQQTERRAFAQVCAWTPGSTATGSPLCNFVGNVFIGGLQIGATGFPITVTCTVSGTTNGASEVDVTPSCLLPTSTAAGKILAEVFCAVSGGSGPSLSAWIKSGTQVAVSPSAAPGANVPFVCLVVGH